MKKLDENKNRSKGNNLAHLVSLAAIIALLIVLMIVLCIKTAANRKSEESLASIDFTEGLEGARREDVELRLEEVQKYLKTLEGAVNDSTTTLNTMYDSRSEEEKEKLKESSTKLTSIEERISRVNTEITDLLKEISSNEETDINVILEKFATTSSEVDKLRTDTSSLIEELKQSSDSNKSEMTEAMNKIEASLDESTKKTEASIASSLDKITSSLNESITTGNSSLTDAINRGNTSLTDTINQGNTSIADAISQGNTSLADAINQGNSTLTEMISQSNSSVSDAILSSNDGLAASIAALESVVSEGFSRADANFEAVFQCVADAKNMIASALATIGSVIEQDADDDTLSFETLAETIEHSQDIPGEYTDGESSQSIVAANPDNLSEGCAAWVEGHLVVGNGADVRTSYNNGYAEGFAVGLEQGLSREANVEYIYHKHVDADGNETDATTSTTYGGCFTSEIMTAVTTKCPGTIYCNSWEYLVWIPGYAATGSCNVCGAPRVVPESSGGYPGYTAPCYQITGSGMVGTGTYQYGCGKNTETIESVIITFDQQ